MAQNRLSTGILGRTTGGSILARAAYNHRTQYRDERTGILTEDHSAKRDDLEWEDLFAKDKNNVPEWWFESRERVFNELEKREDRSTRPDTAQLAYDFKISIPHELNAEQRKELVSGWAMEQVRKGYVVDVAIHKPNPKENDPRNFHAHILMPMRPIDRDGWGNKFRAPGNSKTAFNKWAQENLREWKEQFSELGAKSLDRAGLHAEAERFRIGHLSRPERAKAAHDRGDIPELERLLDEPQRYMGPAASAMERGGKHTRTGDINREVEERNKLRGPTRDIRFAFALADGDHHAFIKSLDEKHMALARISRADAQDVINEFACEPIKYVPQYRRSEHVIVTETGQVHRLTPTTTGENWKAIREFSKQLYDRALPSLAIALEEQKQRSRIPNVDRNEVIEKLMQPGSLDGTGREAGEEPQRQRTAVPDGARHLNVRGANGAQVWWAYNSSQDPEAFQNSLKERGLHFARVTEDDARDSQTQHWAAKRQGAYHPTLREGEYVALNERGQACRLHEGSVGHDLREMKAFMSKLDGKLVPSLAEARKLIEEKRLASIDPRPWSDLPEQKLRGAMRHVVNTGKQLPASTLEGAGKVVRGGFKMLSFVSGIADLFSPRLTPEQKMEGEIAGQERRVADEQAVRRHREPDRGR